MGAPPHVTLRCQDGIETASDIHVREDITERHVLTRGTFNSIVGPQLDAGSPLAEWMTAFLGSTFAKMESLTPGVSGDVVGLALHDP